MPTVRKQRRRQRKAHPCGLEFRSPLSAAPSVGCLTGSSCRLQHPRRVVGQTGKLSQCRRLQGVTREPCRPGPSRGAETEEQWLGAENGRSDPPPIPDATASSAAVRCDPAARRGWNVDRVAGAERTPGCRPADPGAAQQVVPGGSTQVRAAPASGPLATVTWTRRGRSRRAVLTSGRLEAGCLVCPAS